MSVDLEIFHSRVPSNFTKSKNLNSYLRKHLMFYPNQTWQDLYKLIFQGHFGAVHFNTASNQNHIRSELKTVSKGKITNILEKLPPDGTFARLNFFPLKSIDQKLNDLTQLISKITLQQEAHQISKAQFLSFWYEEVCQKSIKINQDNRKLLVIKDLESLPTFHHSAIYRTNYAPAYRVVNTKTAIQSLLNHSIPVTIG